MIVYLITNLVNGKVYVGKTCRSLSARWSGHVSKARHGKDCLISQAIRKYGSDRFQVQVLASCTSLEELDLLERKFILEYRSNVRGVGYNQTPGGDGAPKGNKNRLGISHTVESKARMSFSHTGLKQPMTDERRAKISASMKGKQNAKGRILSAESREKIRRAHIGMKASLESRLKMSESRRRYYASSSSAVPCLNTRMLTSSALSSSPSLEPR